MQPAPQSMGNFPTSHGKTASFFLNTGVQEEYAFIPDDGSATYVVNVAVSLYIYILFVFILFELCCVRDYSKTLPRRLLVLP